MPKNRNKPINQQPFVTIIMPIRNEAIYIARSLESILKQDYPPYKIEIIIVDGMSTDDTRRVIWNTVDAYQLALPAISILDNPAKIVPTALNIGLQHAQGNVIIRVDGHCEIAHDYVQRCVEILQATDANCVGGPMTTTGETPIARAIALAQSSFFGVGGVAFRTGRREPGYVDTLAFGAYRRETFNWVGMFDEELVRNQDDEFNFRLTQAGGKIWLDPSIKSTYFSRATLRGLWRQYYQYGFFKVRIIQKHGRVPSWRHLVPGSFVLGILGTIFLALLTKNRRWLGFVVGPYAIVNILAAIWTARHNWSTLPLLPLIFFILHAAYGVGFLHGLQTFSHSFTIHR